MKKKKQRENNMKKVYRYINLYKIKDRKKNEK